jgi:hypothetical protein
VECIATSVFQSLGEAIAYAIAVAIAVLLYSVVVVFVIGCIAAWLVVRRIRRLEPGIIGRQTAGVTVGWGCGSIVAGISAILAAAYIAQAAGLT